MANYTTHVVVGSATGAAAILGAWILAPGMGWEAHCVAFAAGYVGGLFPDLDHDTGIGLSEVSALLSTLVPVIALANFLQQDIWALIALIPCHYLLHLLAKRLPFMGERQGIGAGVRATLVASICSGAFLLLIRDPPYPHLILWGLMGALALLIQIALPLFKRATVHRGIFHSIPAILIYALALHLATFRYPAEERLLVLAAAFAGALSHLILDEIYAVDLGGARLKKSFGTALSLWKPKTPLISALAWGLVLALVIGPWALGLGLW